MSMTCDWCGCIYDHYREANGRFCSEKCKHEYEESRARKNQLDDIKAMERERLAIERRRERMEEERIERIRKADPNQWYGNEWVEHLLVHPEDADKCKWAKLESKDIRILLEKHPQFVNRVDLDVLTAGSWSRLLMKRPEFGEKCTKWSKIDAEHWIMLLKVRKEFASKCSFSSWVEILSCDISLRKYCDFSQLNSKQATILLMQVPQLATEFDKSVLENIDLGARANVLCKYPKLESEIKGWNDFSGYSEEQMVKMLSDSPSLLGRFPTDQIDLMTAKTRFSLLLKHPNFIKEKWFSDWFIFSPRQQFELLYAHKEFSKYCSWESFSKEMWEKLLGKYPDFKEHRDKVIEFLRVISGDESTAKAVWDHHMPEAKFGRYVRWDRIAKEKPEIVSTCFFRDTGIFRTDVRKDIERSGDQYSFTLTIGSWIREYPEVIRCIDWTNCKWWCYEDINKFVGEIFFSYFPHPSKKIDERCKAFLKALRNVHKSFFKYLDDSDWRSLIMLDSYFLQYCPYTADELNISWSDIVKNPALLSFCNLTKLDECDWRHILDAHPELLSKCGIVDKLSESSVWSYRVALDEHLLSTVPEKIKLDWEVILSYNPAIAAKCNKHVLRSISATGWCDILCKHPQLFSKAKSCSSVRKFDKYDWSRIIEAHPKFKNEYRKWCVARFFGSFFRMLFYTSFILAVLGGISYGVLNYASESTLATIRGVWEKGITVWTDICAKVVSVDYRSVAKTLAKKVGLLAIIILFVWWWIRRAVKTFSKRRWKFLLLGLFLGFLGLHLAYAKRWMLFGLSCVIALMAYQASNYGLLFVFWGLTTFFIKKDGNGNRM